MRFFSFFKFLKSAKRVKQIGGAEEYIPSFWPDDYCQIEIVPSENKGFIQDQARQIEQLSARSGSEYGFTEILNRNSMPTPTISKEFRIDYLERTLAGCHFPKAKFIRYERSQLLDCESGKTKAFGFPYFTIFFDTDGEFVKNIWLHIAGMEAGQPMQMVEDAMYILGEGCQLILVDWNSLELADMSDKTQIRRYLAEYGKSA